MKRYLGIHMNPFAVRAAVFYDGIPSVVTGRDGSASYSAEGLFSCKEGVYVGDAQKLTHLLTQIRSDAEKMVGSSTWEMVLTIPNAFGDVLESKTLRPSALTAGIPVACVLREGAAIAMNYFWNGIAGGEEVFRMAIAMVTPQTVSTSVWELYDEIAEELATVGRIGDIDPSGVKAAMEQARKEADAAAVHALLINHEAARRPEYRDMIGKQKKPGQKIYGYPEESAALGAALHGAKLGGEALLSQYLLLTAAPYDYWIQTADGRFVKCFSRNTATPAKTSQVYTTAKDQQTEAVLRLFASRGDEKREWVQDLRLQGITPKEAGKARIQVTVDMDARGKMTVSGGECKEEALLQVTVSGALPAGKGQTTKESPEKKTTEKPASDMISMAEFENFRRRMTQEKDAMYDKGICKALEKILPVVDSFERGLTMLSSEQRNSEAAVGMERIYRQMLKSLEELGVRPIEAIGRPFDLKLHNAVMQGEVPGVAENIIIEEFEKGYLYHDTVVRYSVVKVNK